MGIEPYLISSSLLYVLAQRLVRRLCEHCKEIEDNKILLEPHKLMGKLINQRAARSVMVLATLDVRVSVSLLKLIKS